MRRVWVAAAGVFLVGACGRSALLQWESAKGRAGGDDGGEDGATADGTSNDVVGETSAGDADRLDAARDDESADGNPTEDSPNFACQDAGETLCNGVCVDEQSDPHNCGGCGIVCAGTCTGGRCLTVVVPVLGQANGIAVDSTSVYWTESLTNGNSDTVMKVPLAGGAMVTLYSAPGWANGIAVDATDVYWVNNPGDVKKVPISGGPVVTLASTPQPDAGPAIVTGTLAALPLPLSPGAIATEVYWPTMFGVLASSTNGGTESAIAPPAETSGIAVDRTHVYWATPHEIMATPLGGGTSVTLAANQVQPTAIATDGVNVYWTNWVCASCGGSVVSVPVAGGLVQTIASHQESPWGIATDGINVYWGTEGQSRCQGALLRMSVPSGSPPLGSNPVTLATGQDLALAVAVDSTSVYWTQSSCGNGTVMRLTPK